MDTGLVTAIDIERARLAWSDEPYTKQPVAWVVVEGGEVMVNITREQYQEWLDDLERIAYKEADYAAFNRPVEWNAVMPAGESRGL